MTGLISRASAITKAKVSKLLDRAEDPGETLDYSYEKQLELLQNVKRGLADVVTAKKRLQLQQAQLEQSVVKLDGQAHEAVAAGSEDLARTALERKSAIQQQLQGLDAQVQQLQAQQDKLVASEQQLQAKVEAFRSQKEVIKAQYSAAEAQVKIGEAATGIGEQMADTGLAIQRAKDKTEQMQARAGAMDELIDSGALEDVTAYRRRHRPAARGALVQEPGRRRAGEDQGRGRDRRRQAEGALLVIVRLMHEGQYEVPDSLRDELNAADDRALTALANGDVEALNASIDEMWELVRANGDPLPANELTPGSDVIVPPSDLTLEEAQELLTGEGLIPDLPG